MSTTTTCRGVSPGEQDIEELIAKVFIARRFPCDLVYKTIGILSENFLLIVQFTFLNTTFYETMDVSTSSTKSQRIVQEMQWSNAKSLGQAFLS